MTIREKLAADHPQVMDYLAALSSGYSERAWEAMAKGSLQEAETFLREALRLRQQWVAASPDRPFAKRCLAESYHRLGQLLEARDRLEEAEIAHRRGLALTEKLAAEFPRCQTDFADSRNTLARLLSRAARSLSMQTDIPVPEWQRAVEQALEAAELAPRQGGYSNTLGIAHYRAGNWKEAIEALDRSERLDSKGELPSVNAFFLAMAHWRLDEKTEAHKSYDKAVEWMDENKPEDEQLRRFRAEAAALLGIGDAPDEEKTEKEMDVPTTDDPEREDAVEGEPDS
jgi:tetratricopeptide (TPR) repeat protein